MCPPDMLDNDLERDPEDIEEATFYDVYQDGDLMLDHIPSVAECRRLRAQFRRDGYWPNVFHVNERGNVDLLQIGWNGAKIIHSWV